MPTLVDASHVMFVNVPLRLAFGLVMVATAVCTAQSPSPDRADPLAGLKPGHPRLLVSEADWQALRERQEGDAELGQVTARIEADAKSLLARPPLVYRKEGKRLLDVSRQALERILLWSVTYHLAGEHAYAERARRELLNLSAFKDWNPSHFLDTAEMTAAMALGYDWLYDELDPQSRATIRRAIVQKGLLPGLAAGKGRGSWHRARNNWNQVCFGGLTLGALAVGDEEPGPARRLLEAAHIGIKAGLRPYAPDGVYPEGPGYWGYGTVYQVLMLSALTEFKEDPNPSATVDLTPVFRGQADRVVRHFALGPERTVYVRDELAGLAPGIRVRWAMVTRAKVELAGNRATLRQNGKTLQARLLSPAKASFAVIPADPPDDGFDAPNPDTRILVVSVAAPASGRLELGIALRPGSVEP